jgi:catechol 2,3-dioxygenase-like lactoylglutathione lyase family enzyme
MTQTQSPTRITSIDTVLVPVDNQDKALEFYVGVLGFEKRVDVPYGNGDRWITVAPAGGATTVALCAPMQGAPAPSRDNAHCCFISDDVQADHAYLKSRGVDLDDIMPGGGPVPAMFFFRDPDGNSMLIVQRGA